jgi:hypothetical protein
LTADPNSARPDLEPAAIFAGADSDYGGADRVHVVASLGVVVILPVANAKSTMSGIG